MPRNYIVTFSGVTVSAAQDLLQIKGAAGKLLRVRRLWLSFTNTTLPTAQGLQLRCRFLPATVTDGTGGTTPTPRPLDAGDAAATFTALANNTTKATTSGTAAVLNENGYHVHGSFDWFFPIHPLVGPSQSFVFELLSTPSGTLNLSGGAEVEEAG